jgi:translation initiation factor 3 subunit E
MEGFTKTFRYLDPHFIIPMIDFIEGQNLESKDFISKARIELIAGTSMVDYLIDLHKEANLPVTEELENKRATIASEYESRQSQLRPLLEVVEKNGSDSLKQMSLADFCLKYNLSADILDILFDYSRLSYQCGDYETSSQLLKIYRQLTSSTDSVAPTDKQIRAMWGSVACYIVLEQWSAAGDLILKLIEFFDTQTLPREKFSTGASMLWLLHWAMLIILRSPELPTTLVSVILRDRFLSIVSSSAPYLWRYISAIVILSEGKISNLVEIVQTMNRDAPDDEINSKLISIYLNYNLNPIDDLEIENDFYLFHKKLNFNKLIENLKFKLFRKLD